MSMDRQIHKRQYHPLPTRYTSGHSLSNDPLATRQKRDGETIDRRRSTCLGNPPKDSDPDRDRRGMEQL